MVRCDVWESIIRKNDSVFVRSLLNRIYGKNMLAKKCLSEKKANKNNEGPPRTQITPEKRELVGGMANILPYMEM